MEKIHYPPFFYPLPAQQQFSFLCKRQSKKIVHENSQTRIMISKGMVSMGQSQYSNFGPVKGHQYSISRKIPLYCKKWKGMIGPYQLNNLGVSTQILGKLRPPSPQFQAKSGSIGHMPNFYQKLICITSHAMPFYHQRQGWYTEQTNSLLM